jgi:hypothetical protein
MNKKITPTLFLLMIILIFNSCSGEGIFYNIQNEVKIIDKGLPNAKFLDVHNTDPLSSGGYYIARGVKLWYRSKSISSEWTKIDMPSGADAIQSSTMYNGDFYYTVKIGDSAALYRVDNADTTAPGSGVRVFTVNPATSGNYIVLQLFSNEDSGQNRIFMNTIEYNSARNSISSTLRYQEAGVEPVITSSALFPSCVVNSVSTYPVMGMAFGDDTNNANRAEGNAWIIYNEGDRGYLYRSTDNFDSVSTNVSPTSTGKYEAVYGRNITPDLVVLSVVEGEINKLYSNSNAALGNTWSSTDTGTVYLSCFAWADSLVTNYIVAGAKSSSSYNKGIYLINSASLSVAADGGTLADSANYSSSDLKNSSVYGIMVDENAASTTAVLAATSKDSSNGGIWFLNGTKKIWNHE